jgi:hypothetical protein
LNLVKNRLTVARDVESGHVILAVGQNVMRLSPKEAVALAGKLMFSADETADMACTLAKDGIDAGQKAHGFLSKIGKLLG